MDNDVRELDEGATAEIGDASRDGVQQRRDRGSWRSARSTATRATRRCTWAPSNEERCGLAVGRTFKVEAVSSRFDLPRQTREQIRGLMLDLDIDARRGRHPRHR